ncbi:MAG: NAD-dependent epimerase/dehydratase family protein, partial [Myxococcota bacterium]
VYGPRQRPEMAIHLFASRILNNEPIRMHGDGASSRDYTYIDDIVAGVLGAIDRCVKTEEYRIYNLGGSETTTLRGLIEQIEAACGRRAQIQQVADQPGDVPRTFADISRARAELGYDPRTPVAEGIVRFVEWLKRPQ